MKLTHRERRQIETTLVLDEQDMANLAALMFLADEGRKRLSFSNRESYVNVYRGFHLPGIAEFRAKLHDQLINLLENRA